MDRPAPGSASPRRRLHLRHDRTVTIGFLCGLRSSKSLAQINKSRTGIPATKKREISKRRTVIVRSLHQFAQPAVACNTGIPRGLFSAVGMAGQLRGCP